MADEGVGPSIALGNQEEKGNCADLAAAARSSINPIPFPIPLFKFGSDRFGIGSALAGENNIHLHEGIHIVGIDQGRSIHPHIRCFLASLGGGKENRGEFFEIILRGLCEGLFELFRRGGFYHLWCSAAVVVGFGFGQCCFIE